VSYGVFLKADKVQVIPGTRETQKEITEDGAIKPCAKAKFCYYKSSTIQAPDSLCDIARLNKNTMYFVQAILAVVDILKIRGQGLIPIPFQPGG